MLAEWSVLSPKEKIEASKMVYNHILSLASDLFHRADEERNAVKTADEALDYIRGVRSRFRELVGWMPDVKDPPQAQRVGLIKKDDYILEKLIYESLPGLHIPAHLYIPKREEKPPVILFISGHWAKAKAEPFHQKVASRFAKNGLAVFFYDPYSQGERIQYYDPWRMDSRIGGSTSEHTYTGLQALLVGSSMAALMILDAVRAIDYLEGRDDLDATRLGCTGASGGGTLTSYMMTFDDRVKAAVPVCYLCTRGRWLKVGGWADAEQNINCAFRWIDQSDFCVAMAPKPLLIGAARYDFFPIDGTLEIYRRAEKFYRLLGAEDKLKIHIAEEEHGYHTGTARAACRWFLKWLAGREDDVDDYELVSTREEDLWCCPRGQVHSLGGLRGVGIVKFRAERLAKLRRPTLDRDELSKQLRNLLKIDRGLVVAQEATVKESLEVKGGVLKKVVLRPEPGIILPGILLEPSRPKGSALIVDGSGKDGSRGLAEDYFRESHRVLSIDLRGVGETLGETPSHPQKDQLPIEFFNLFNYAMACRTYLGSRLLDVLASLDYLRDGDILIHGRRLGSVLSLMAAVIDERIGEVVCEDGPASYNFIAVNDYYDYAPSYFVAGLLEYFDLQDLAASLPPKKLTMLNLRDHSGQIVPIDELTHLYAPVLESYKETGYPERITIKNTLPTLSLRI